MKERRGFCSRYYTLNDGDQITTGEFNSTVGTKYDFLQPHTIGERFDAEPNPEPTALGYDLNYVLWNNDGPAAKAATVNCVVGPEYATLLGSTEPPCFDCIPI